MITSPSGRDLIATPPPRIRPRVASAGSFFGSADRIDEHRTFGNAQHMAFANRLTEHGHFGQPRLEQPAVADALGFALARNAHFHIEPIAFLNARPQERAGQHHRSRARGEHFVRIRDVAALHFIEQCGALRRRRRIGTGAAQSRDERNRFDLHIVHAVRMRVLRDVLHVRHQRHIDARFGTLRPQNRSAASAEHNGGG